MVDDAFWLLVVNTVGVALAAAMLSVLLALLLAYGLRLKDNLGVKLAVRIAGMGYAVPGIVVAVGVLLPFAVIDNTIDGWMRARFGISTGLLLSGSLFVLLFAYLVRFLAVSLQAVEAGLEKHHPGDGRGGPFARSFSHRGGTPGARTDLDR